MFKLLKSLNIYESMEILGNSGRESMELRPSHFPTTLSASQGEVPHLLPAREAALGALQGARTSSTSAQKERVPGRKEPRHQGEKT